jgi:two-component system sensor histidine kinase UhpB
MKKDRAGLGAFHPVSTRPVEHTGRPSDAGSVVAPISAGVDTWHSGINATERSLLEDTRYYDQSPFGFLTLDSAGHILALNRFAANLLGEERGRIVGRPLRCYLSADSRDRLYMHLHACGLAARAAINLRLRSTTAETYRDIELISLRDPRYPERCHTVMIDEGPCLDLRRPLDVNAETRSPEDIARVIRFIKAQRYELESQNRQLRDTQRLLEESRDRYARLYEFAPIGYMSMDDAGCVRVLNMAAADIVGGERANIAGTSLAQYLDETNVVRFRDHLEMCRSGAQEIRTELTFRTAKGDREIEMISAVPGSDDHEGTLCHSALMDITERKSAAKALENSEAKLRWLIDNMPAVLWIRDENGGPRYVSANIMRVLGFAEHEVRSGGARFWSDNVHPEDRARVHEAYARMFADPESRTPTSYDIEYRRQARDGSWVWVVDRGMSVSQEQGERYATGMFWDTTRRKRMQEQLRESEERFRQLAEHINDVFFLTDVDGRQIFYVSPTFEKLWGYSADALYREPGSWLRIVYEKDRQRVRRAVRTRRSHTPFDQEFRIRRPNGVIRWVRMRGFPIYDSNGQMHRLAGIAVDVTARKEAGEALQRSHQRMRELALHLQSVREEERKHIAREIHDELGALLLAIKMDAEACRRRSPGRTASDRARTLSELVGRVDAAIASVRRIATDLRPSILDNVGVLAAVEWEAQDMQRRTGIRCEVQMDTDKEELDVDPDRATAIFRIVQEALSNVVRHSKATHVKIALHERNGNVEVSIADDGTGLGKQAVPDPGRWGLVGMSERVSAFQGQFDIRAADPHGTIITATIPARA